MDYNSAYYNEDQQVGERCFFDDKDVYVDFNADLKSFSFNPGELNTDFRVSVGVESLTLYQNDDDPAELILEFYVGGPSYEAVQTNISGLLLAAKECVIRKQGDIFEYAALLTDRKSEDTGVEPYYLVTCTFAAVRRKPLRVLSIESNAAIYNDGNQESGVRIVFVPKKDMSSFTIMGITIENLKKDISYAIDGISGKVTADGVNYFAHTDLINFPKVLPGKNEIVMSEPMSVTISFYPVFS